MGAGASKMEVIKELRERSGAPMMDVKNALAEAQWDIEQAMTLLRQRGVAAASKKVGRRAAEGLVGMAEGPKGVAVVEINSETDFVSKDSNFQHMVAFVSQAALQLSPGSVPSWATDVQELQKTSCDGTIVEDAIADVAGTIRENVHLRRAFYLPSEGGTVGRYMHNSQAPGLGGLAAAVRLRGAGAESAEGRELARKLAMHVAASGPQYLRRQDVPEEVMDAERAVLREAALQSGKPAGVVDKMVQGRLGKWAQEQCLLQQIFLFEEEKTVDKVLQAAKLEVDGFLRVKLGEGVAAGEGKDFAQEVAETLMQG